VDPDLLAPEANLKTLQTLIQAPCLGAAPWMDAPDARAIAACLQVGR